MEIGQAPRFVPDRGALDAGLLEAKLWACPHCGRTGALVGHGLLVGYAEDGAFPVVRGRRFFCSNRDRRPGCGHTFSVLLAEVVRGFVIRALSLFRFVAAVVAGQSRRAAWQTVVAAAFSVTSGYRLWRRLCAAQSHLRTRLARCSVPPPSASQLPWAQLLDHLRQELGSQPFADFQSRFQLDLLG